MPENKIAQPIETLGALVLDLHVNHNADLTIVLPTDILKLPEKKNAGFEIHEKTLCFSSIESRNSFLASYLFDKHREELQSDLRQWLQTAHDVWCHEIGSSDRAAGRLLALVHESKDIFLIAANAIECGYMEVFAVLHVIEAALPYLSRIEPKSILRLCDVQYDKTKNDLMAGAFLSQLQKKLTEFPETCRLLHELLRSEISQTSVALHPVTLQALAASSGEEATKLVSIRKRNTPDLLIYIA